jgi:hypothetical protein
MQLQLNAHQVRAIRARSSASPIPPISQWPQDEIIEIGTTRLFKVPLSVYVPKPCGSSQVCRSKSPTQHCLQPHTPVFQPGLNRGWIYEQNRDKFPLVSRSVEPNWGILALPKSNPQSTDRAPNQWRVPACYLIDLYIFDQTYRIPRLQQDTLDLLYAQFKWNIIPGNFLILRVERAYETTGPSVPLRSLLVDAFCVFSTETDRKRLSEMPGGFVSDVTERYHVRAPKKMPDPCAYHQHGDGVPPNSAIHRFIRSKLGGHELDRKDRKDLGMLNWGYSDVVI